jgi:hypothetical protein
MSLAKPFFLIVAGASFWNTPAGNGVEDALVLLAFFTGATALGGAIFWLRHACGAGEICRLDLPPGPPAVWKVPTAA